MRRILAVFLMVAGCTEVTGGAVAPAPGIDLSSCGGGPFAPMIGKGLADLQLAGLPVSARIIRPGTAVTMDYSAERLNVMLDGNDRVTQLTCG